MTTFDYVKEFALYFSIIIGLVALLVYGYLKGTYLPLATLLTLDSCPAF